MADALAGELLGSTVLVLMVPARFGSGELRDDLPDEATIAADVDLAAIRAAVAGRLP